MVTRRALQQIKEFTKGIRGHKQFAALSATLAIVLLQPGCDGFFVDPVLTGMTVGPAATIQTGTTVQMNAVGTYNDGSQKDLKGSSVFWSSGTPSIATISTTGLVTGRSPGQALITGASGTVTGTVTVTVTIGGLTSIQVTTADGLTSIPYGSTEQFVATGTANGQPVDITDSVHWSTNPSNINDVSIDSNSGLLTTTSGPTTTQQFTVVAIDPTTNLSGQINFTVHP